MEKNVEELKEKKDSWPRVEEEKRVEEPKEKKKYEIKEKEK